MRKIKVLFLLFISCTCFISFSQSDLRKVAVSDLPKGIEEIDSIAIAVRWTDSLGDNILVTTKKIIESAPEKKGLTNHRKYKDLEVNGSTKLTLTRPSYAVHYIITNDSAILTWRVMGIIKHCKDEGLNHAKNWFVVTDLDNDNKAEAWIIYRSICAQKDQEDTGIIKIFMYENDLRYTISTSLEEKSLNGDSYDYNFKAGPAIFRKYGNKLWKKFAAE